MASRKKNTPAKKVKKAAAKTKKDKSQEKPTQDKDQVKPKKVTKAAEEKAKAVPV